MARTRDVARTALRRSIRSAVLTAALLGGVLVPTAALALEDLDVAIGRALFKRPWTPAPSSTTADDGLGPLFDARSCAACHPGSGRASARFDAHGALEGRGVILIIGRPDGSGDPVYGRRLQIDAVPGLKPEGILGAADSARPDGRRARRPQVSDLAYGPLDPASGLSLRVAPDLHGRGDMARVSDATLLALEAEQAKGTDGVHGHARRITRPDGTIALGRFGWKANQPSLTSQSAEAFALDLGLSNPLHPDPWGDCTPAQTACRAAPHGTRAHGPRKDADDLEIPEAVLARVVAYVAALPTPAARPATDATTGAALFAAVGCAQCHRPTLPMSGGGTARIFSDMLLHDMGAELADGLIEPDVSPAQWRTAPLAGMSQALSRDAGLLHDGRARTVAEAVDAHGGEAAGAAHRFKALPDDERAALIAYVSSL